MSTQVMTAQPMQISMTQIELQDEYIDLDEITLLSNSSAFKFERKQPLDLENTLNIQY